MNQNYSTDSFQWKPQIPQSFYRINQWYSTLMLLTGLSLYCLPLICAYFLLHLKINIPLKCVVIVGMGLLTASGNALLAIFTHEAAHYSLYQRRIINQILGIIAISSTPSAFLACTRFFERHGHHHQYFHGKNDPEEIFTPCYSPSLTKKMMLLGMKNTLRYLFDYSFVSLKYFVTVNKISENINCIAHKKEIFIFEFIFYSFSLGIQIYFMIIFPPLILVYLIANLFALILIVFVNHSSHRFGKGVSINNKIISKWLARLFVKASFGTYLHIEHHAYPTVPACHLPALGRYLYAQDFYNKNNILLGTIHDWAIKAEF